MYLFNEISTTELSELLHENEICLIDARSADAYNGWQLKNELRGGHIEKARCLPAKWTKYIDWIEVVKHKKITQDKKIIIYGYDSDESNIVAERFLKSGFNKVLVYNHFVDEWLSNPKLQIRYLARFKHLVHAEWLSKLISNKGPQHYNNDKYVIVHVHYRNRDAYLGGHIPGAIDMDTLSVEAPETWNRRLPGELKTTFEQHGITANTTVILYGKYMNPDNNEPFPGSAAGDIGALRVAFIMMYAGVKDVRVLNGGFQSWTDHGFEVSYADERKIPVKDFGAHIPTHPEIVIDTPEAKHYILAPGKELVCVRSWPEYIGEVSGYNYIQKKGRIPGAVFADCGTDAYHMENYRNIDNTCREYHEIAQNWIKNGITPDKDLAFYCGTGWRGSEAWFNAWLMAWPNVSVYDGGWFEWSNDPANPIETGIPEHYLVD